MSDDWVCTNELKWVRAGEKKPGFRYRLESYDSSLGCHVKLVQKWITGKQPTHHYPKPDKVLEISGRGTVRVYNNQQEPQVGDIVTIEGEYFWVRDVEGNWADGVFGLIARPTKSNYQEEWRDVLFEEI